MIVFRKLVVLESELSSKSPKHRLLWVEDLKSGAVLDLRSGASPFQRVNNVLQHAGMNFDLSTNLSSSFFFGGGGWENGVKHT